MTITEMPMPAAWASYLINGDASGLNDGEAARIDVYLEANEVKHVLGDDGEEAYFSWNFDLYGGEAKGGELLNYSVEVRA